MYLKLILISLWIKKCWSSALLFFFYTPSQVADNYHQQTPKTFIFQQRRPLFPLISDESNQILTKKSYLPLAINIDDRLGTFSIFSLALSFN